MNNTEYGNEKLFTLLLISLLILIVYSNSFDASWQLDDKPNIIQNPNIQINDLKPSSIFQTFFASPEQSENVKRYNITRPVSFFTFGLNWYFGGSDVFGYHVVNIFIHILTALFLFIVILNLFQSPRLEKSNYSCQNKLLIAGTATVLWAINPIQTEAVTYIVQRMTLLAAFFYISGLCFYLKFRQETHLSKKSFFVFFCLVCYLLAFSSKENALMMPFAILLVEIIFFVKIDSIQRLWKLIYSISFVLVLIIFFGYLSFELTRGDLFSYISELYSERYFTLYERLLTEPRIILKYISLIFYPIPERLSIEHDIVISKTLLQPWTTIPAILSVFVIIGIGITQIRTRPFLSFGLLFFFINHLIESTFLPLELFFEHRNYLPSFFLFLPVAAGLNYLIDYYRSRKKFYMYGLLIFFIPMLMIGFGYGTYARNDVWASEKTLWEDASRKAPDNVRPLYNLANSYYMPNGYYDIALDLYEKTLFLKSSKPEYSTVLSLNGMSHVYYLKQEYQTVIELCHKALSIDPEFAISRHNLLLALMKIGNWGEALNQINILLSINDKNPLYLKFKGLVLIHRHQYGQALSYMRNYLKLRPNNPEALIYMGFAYRCMGMHEKAGWFYRVALNQDPSNLMCVFCLIENQLMIGDPVSADIFATSLLKKHNLLSIENELHKILRDNFLLPVSTKTIVPVITKNLYSYSNDRQNILK